VNMRWISVKEGYPELCDKWCQRVLVYDTENLQVCEAEFRYDENKQPIFVEERGEGNCPSVTHWMPLPPPPKRRENGSQLHEGK